MSTVRFKLSVLVAVGRLRPWRACRVIRYEIVFASRYAFVPAIEPQYMYVARHKAVLRWRERDDDTRSSCEIGVFLRSSLCTIYFGLKIFFLHAAGVLRGDTIV